MEKKNTEKQMKLYKKRSYDVYKNNDTEKIDFKKSVKKDKPSSSVPNE